MSAHSTDPPLIAHVIYALHTGPVFTRRINAPDVEIHELHKRPGHDLKMYWRLWRLLRRLRPAIVHSRNLAALETQVLRPILPAAKRVHGEHGRDVRDLDGSSRKFRLFRKCMRLFVDHYIAVSHDLTGWLEEAINIPPAKITQIYNGVDTERFFPAEQKPEEALPPGFLPNGDALVIGTVGRLAAVKDQRLILQAMQAEIEQEPQWRERLRCVIVGDGPLRESLETLIDDLDLEYQVWLTGDRADVPELLRAMDIFLLPSLGEGISNTILEAMATGLPVIASDVGGNPELVEEGVTGLRFAPGSVEALRRALSCLLNSPALRKHMGETAQARIERDFDWDRTVSAYLGVYDRLLGREPLPTGTHFSGARAKRDGDGGGSEDGKEDKEHRQGASQ